MKKLLILLTLLNIQLFASELNLILRLNVNEFRNFGHIVDDYSITPTFGINYNATEDSKFNISVLGTAIITSVKVGL